MLVHKPKDCSVCAGGVGLSDKACSVRCHCCHTPATRCSPSACSSSVSRCWRCPGRASSATGLGRAPSRGPAGGKGRDHLAESWWLSVLPGLPVAAAVLEGRRPLRAERRERRAGAFRKRAHVAERAAPPPRVRAPVNQGSLPRGDWIRTRKRGGLRRVGPGDHPRGQSVRMACICEGGAHFSRGCRSRTFGGRGARCGVNPFFREGATGRGPADRTPCTRTPRTRLTGSCSPTTSPSPTSAPSSKSSKPTSAAPTSSTRVPTGCAWPRSPRGVRGRPPPFRRAPRHHRCRAPRRDRTAGTCPRLWTERVSLNDW